MTPEELANEEERFLAAWSSQIKGFIKDGVVNPEEYCKADMKLLFLLKEVNGGADWDLREFLRNGGRKQTWNNGARWVHGILEKDKDIPWAEIENVDEEYRKKWLNKIAVVNVKKTSGGHTSNDNEILESAQSNGSMLRAQLDIYHPNIIICGGTSGYYFNEITEYTHYEWKMTPRGIYYVVEPTGRIIISYCHPEARVKDCLLYYGLMDAVRFICSNEFIK